MCLKVTDWSVERAERQINVRTAHAPARTQSLSNLASHHKMLKSHGSFNAFGPAAGKSKIRIMSRQPAVVHLLSICTCM